MKKVPVWQTIAFAYRFLFRNITGILRVTWISALINAAGGYWLSRFLAEHRAEFDAGDFSAFTPVVMLAIFATLLVSLYASGVAAVGLTREAFGLSTGGSPLYFPLGRTERRMFAALLRYILGVSALFLLALAVSGAAFELSGLDLEDAQQEMTPAQIFALALSVALSLYAGLSALRMGFFLPATITAEKRGGLRRSHELTKGNLGRIIIVGVAVTLPFLLLMQARAALTTGVLTGPEQPLVSQLFTLVISILFSGLFYSASAYAYRAVIGLGESDYRETAAT